jgi:hypothetical protein
MRLRKQAAGATLVLAVAFAAGSITLSADAPAKSRTKQVAAQKAAPTPVFATLKGVKAVPMAAAELDTIKGMHVHFLDAGAGDLHLAGNPEKNTSNWLELGGSAGPVAPSYHGLCVAAGYSGAGAGAILIPGGQVECP